MSSRQRFKQFREDFRQRKPAPTSLSQSEPKQATDVPGKAPSPQVDSQGRRSSLRRYLGWLRPFRWRILLLFVLSILSVGANLAQPLAFRYIIDDVILAEGLESDRKLDRIYAVAGLIALLLLFYQACTTYHFHVKTILHNRVSALIKRHAFTRFVRLSLNDLQDLKIGGVVSRLENEIPGIASFVDTGILKPGIETLRVIVTLCILFYLSWKLTLVTLLCVLPIFFFSLVKVSRIRPIWRSLQQDQQETSAHVAELFGGIRIVRAFQRENFERLRYALRTHTICRKDVFANLHINLVETGWGLITRFSGLFVVSFGGILVITGNASLGDLISYQIYVLLLIDPVGSIITAMGQVQRSLSTMDRVFEIMDRDPDKPDAPDAVAAPDQVEEVRFSDVCFSYDGDAQAIKDLDLVVPGGAVVAVVGRSGAGKSTLVDLVARFLDPTDGVISLNGIDLRRIKLQSYRRLVGIVEQDVFLFEGTIEENIAYGKPDACPQEIRRVARLAHLDTFIESLPQGYRTLVGERGVKLSGGQRQRISIARAFLADPQILILDEATNNLDTESEHWVQLGLAELQRERTTFVIAHRLSTIVDADLIVVMEEGRIAETGTHSQLMRAKGRYSRMVQGQRAPFAQAPELIDGQLALE